MASKELLSTANFTWKEEENILRAHLLGEYSKHNTNLCDFLYTLPHLWWLVIGTFSLTLKRYIFTHKQNLFLTLKLRHPYKTFDCPYNAKCKRIQWHGHCPSHWASETDVNWWYQHWIEIFYCSLFIWWICRMVVTKFPCSHVSS